MPCCRHKARCQSKNTHGTYPTPPPLPRKIFSKRCIPSVKNSYDRPHHRQSLNSNNTRANSRHSRQINPDNSRPPTRPPPAAAQQDSEQQQQQRTGIVVIGNRWTKIRRVHASLATPSGCAANTFSRLVLTTPYHYHSLLCPPLRTPRFRYHVNK